MNISIAVLPGDGIGPEVIAEGTKVLEAIGKKFGHRFSFRYGAVGGTAIDRFGTALPKETLDICRGAQAILFGAVGGPKWDDPRAKVHPEDAILGLRKTFDLFANLRPVKVFPQLIDASPIKPSVLQGVDLVVVRELTGGLYFGKPKRRWETSRGRRGVDTMSYSEHEIRRVVKASFDLAMLRRKKVTSVDKANVLESSRLWREVTIEVAQEYRDVSLSHMLVDTAAMQLVRNPRQFDVLVTENTFGDILTDEASVLAGSMGMLPSASLGDSSKAREATGAFGLYEPIHGSAPDIAGQGKANPIATILTVAMMLRYSFRLQSEANAIEESVNRALTASYRTPDIASEGTKTISTAEMGEVIIKGL